MKSVITLTTIAAAAVSILAFPTVPRKPNLLIFTKTAGYRHDSIPEGINLITSIANKNHWSVTATEDSSIFSPDGLRNFTSLVFIHTTGDFLDVREFEALHQFLLGGGSWLGIHAAADFGNNTPPWYTTLVGAQFEFHPCAPEWTCSDAQLERYPPGGNIRPDTITLHPTPTNVSKTLIRIDEWYSYRTTPGPSKGYTILATLNESYIDDITPGYLRMKPNHPITWSSVFEGRARAWYTGMGHTRGNYGEEWFVEHVEGGLEWVVWG